MHKNKTVANHVAIATMHDEVKSSSKLSPWLSIGAISIRRVYEELKAFKIKQDKDKESSGAKNFFGSILYSDYFKYWCLINGKKVFDAYGITGGSVKLKETWKTDVQLVFRWREGRTGMPLIDAIMRELNATGHISHRCRMIAASYLTLDLK
jgi:deoxyribodipyrimidine photo-lyase